MKQTRARSNDDMEKKMERARLLLHPYPLLLVLLLLPLFHRGGGVLAAADVPAVPAAARSPGCATRCGDVEVPYPFGLDPQCAIHEGFQLKCNTSSAADRSTRLLHGSLEVIRLSVADGKSWVKTLNSRQCYNRTDGTMDYINAWLNITNLPLVLSAEDNKVIVFGCNSLAYMLNQNYIIGCLSTCGEAYPPTKNGSCTAGAGCCQADVPKGVRYYKVFFNEGYNNSNPELSARTPCNYVAVMEKAAFDFKTTYLTSTEFWDAHESTPAVMEWAIARTTCERARAHKAYACVSGNSECVTNEAGYLCRCSKGYAGNPYLVGGCQDIDECQDNATYPCAGICKNEPGTFTCSCSRGKTMINGVCVQDHKSVWVAPVVGGSVGLVVLVVATACAYLVRERRRLHRIKKKYFRQHGGMLLFEEMKRSQQGGAAFFKIFSEEELQHATNAFDEARVIGHGGHGKVYRGVLKGGDVQVAVKRCMTVDEQHKKEFGKEMLILSQVNHRNIVKLLGCCLEVEVPVLVYEFVPNGTLFHLIHGGGGAHCGRRVSLATRLRIAHESAEALAYLHSCAAPPILHGDVKSTNILLDADYAAKVSDFGASILAPTSDKSQFVTFVQGTCGYLDPEYMQTCELTDKSDVYSFGVVLLELLTRRKAFDLQGPEHERTLLMVFLSALKNNRLVDILDDQIKHDDGAEEVIEEVAELARQCLEMSGVNRPSMKEVADRLHSIRKVMQRHPWTQEENRAEELYSLLGDSSPSIPSTSVVGTTDDFSITKKAAMGLELGR